MKTILIVLVSLLSVSAGWAEDWHVTHNTAAVYNVPARRNVENSDFRYIGNGQYQAEVTIGRHTEVFIMTKGQGEIFMKQMFAVLEKDSGEIYISTVDYWAKPAAR
jgi:hypothetical protein